MTRPGARSIRDKHPTCGMECLFLPTSIFSLFFFSKSLFFLIYLFKIKNLQNNRCISFCVEEREQQQQQGIKLCVCVFLDPWDQMFWYCHDSAHERTNNWSPFFKKRKLSPLSYHSKRHVQMCFFFIIKLSRRLLLFLVRCICVWESDTCFVSFFVLLFF